MSTGIGIYVLIRLQGNEPYIDIPDSVKVNE